ncbi:MAG: hypothetical protein M1826_005795 [Phylliscum demangeonii]|nr:MAG: hypothetical protein M1826_005795 [Phylliscum demangeonii]
MTDSPIIQGKLDPQELPILEKLVALRDKLLLLREDKSCYIKSEFVVPLYEEVIEQVHRLNNVRAGRSTEQNRVDRILDDCFQLISLFFLTIGRNQEAPAVYATTSTVKRLLDHLKEVSFYGAKDLESIDHTLEKIEGIIERAKDSSSPDLLTLLMAKVQACRARLADLHKHIAGLSPQLAPLHEKLISILRSIAAANTRQQFSSAEVKGYQKQLLEIQHSKKDGKFVEASSDDSGQAIVDEILACSLKWAEIILQRQGKIDDAFRPTYEKLRNIRNELEKVSLLKAWALRETDLYGYQRELDKFDESRVNGNFLDEHGNPAERYTQGTLIYLIRRSYAWIYLLIISSEPVSEALLPVYNQLQTLRRCLLEVKKSGGVSSVRELYPYSMKLHSVDNMRVDGKFMVGSDIPEGQAATSELLADCYDLVHDLRVETVP